MAIAARASDNSFLLNCGYRREPGKVRTSTKSWILLMVRIWLNSSAARVECPMVQIVGSRSSSAYLTEDLNCLSADVSGKGSCSELLVKGILSDHLKINFKFESPAFRQQGLPEIAHTTHAPRNIVQTKVVDLQSFFKLAPFYRCGYRGPGVRPN
jgi:hypothetical protein